MPKNTRPVPPDTARTIEGLRDTGYTFEAAVADVIDNSIGPGGAETVMVTFGLNADNSIHVQISDDGCGMDEAGLENGMRYGSNRQMDVNSLSKFGLGLKTASTQFCRRLLVVSRTGPDAPASAAAWDLDRVVKTGEWLLEIGDAEPDERDILEEALEELADFSGNEPGSGTVVVWQKIDRLLIKNSGDRVKNLASARDRALVRLEEHLRMVFQRFLDPDDSRARTVRIILNGRELKPWDPFCVATGGDMVRETKFTFSETPGHTALLRAYILPRKEEFTSAEAAAEARLGLAWQGIYLYREDRMIEGPSWLGTGEKETHINNLRVELSFDAQLDPVFGVGIKKAGVHIDPTLIEQIIDILRPIRREADNRSRKGNASAAASASAVTNKKRPTEVALERVSSNLRLPEVEKRADGAVVMRDTAGTNEVELVSSGGLPTGLVALNPDRAFEDMRVVRKDSLTDGVLWDPALSTNNVLQVLLNSGHDWYRKAYLPVADNLTLVQALEFLFYAMAQAELDKTGSKARRDLFEEIRVDVSRNLRKLVEHLPEPKLDEPESQDGE